MSDKHIIEKLVEEAMDDVLSEAAAPPTKKEISKLLSLFQINEEAWGQKGSYDRSIMSKYVSKLSANMKKFNEYSEGDEAMYFADRIRMLTSEPKGKCETIEEHISRLSLLNSLQIVLNDFGPSGAGFIAESFFAALFDGVKVNVGGGGIEDLYYASDSDKIGFSMKTFKEGSTEFGGSRASFGASFGMPVLRQVLRLTDQGQIAREKGGTPKLHRKGYGSIPEEFFTQDMDGAKPVIYKVEADKIVKVDYAYVNSLVKATTSQAKARAAFAELSNLYYKYEPKAKATVQEKLPSTMFYIINEKIKKAGEIQSMNFSITKVLSPTDDDVKKAFGVNVKNLQDPNNPKQEKKGNRDYVVISGGGKGGDTQFKVQMDKFYADIGGSVQKDKIKVDFKLEDYANDNLGDMKDKFVQLENWYVAFIDNLTNYLTDLKNRPEVVSQVTKFDSVAPQITAKQCAGAAATTAPAPVAETISENKQKALDKLIEEVILESILEVK